MWSCKGRQTLGQFPCTPPRTLPEASFGLPRMPSRLCLPAPRWRFLATMMRWSSPLWARKSPLIEWHGLALKRVFRERCRSNVMWLLKGARVHTRLQQDGLWDP